MKKVIKKISQKTIGIVICLITLINMYIPMTVTAIENGSGDYKLGLDVNETELTNGTFKSMTVNGVAWNEADTYATEDGNYTVVVKLEAESDDYRVGVRTGGGAGTISDPVVNEKEYTYTITYTTTSMNAHLSISPYSEAKQTNNQGGQGNDPQNNDPQNNDPQNQGGNQNNHSFDGSAYFVWECSGKVCYHKVTGLTGMKSDGSGYDMNYVKVDTLTDESGNNVTYKWGQDNANWVLASDMEDGQGAVKAEAKTLSYIFGNGKEDMGVQLNPTNAENGNSSICSNGDMNFRVCITNDSYQAINFSASQNNYKYFPNFWDQTFFTSTLDISKTTKEKPAVYNAYLEEPSISFKVDANVKSVKALDVNSNAVTINKDGLEYTVMFKSNYYDRVVFEITTNDNKKSYVMIARTTILVEDNFRPNVKDKELVANVYYPTASYDEDSFQVVANIVNKNGDVTTKILDSSEIIDEYYDAHADKMVTENFGKKANGGKGLSFSRFKVSVDDDTVGAYFTVVKKGALNSSSNTYAGTFSGSGKGVYYSISQRHIVYTK